MPVRHVSLFVFLCFVPAAASAQGFGNGKGLGFAHVAFGGGYQTVLNLTNRGASAYSGTLNLYPSDPAKPFPAMVNGRPYSAGVSIALDPGATASITISSGDESLGTLSGFAATFNLDPFHANLVEGNLTYYLKAADGTLVDSVAVAPSRQILQSVIPFDDFPTVALALANRNAGPATVRLTLFNDRNVQLGTATQTLQSNQQVPRFLYQYFPGISLTIGRVEIQSSSAILGTALTVARNNQASSLPFLPAMKLYDAVLTLNAQGRTETFTAQVYLSIDLPYITAYSVDTVNGEPPQNSSFEPISGMMRNGNLEIFFGQSPGDLTIGEVLFRGFNPSLRTQTGAVLVYSVDPPGVFAQGTMTLTAINN